MEDKKCSGDYLKLYRKFKDWEWYRNINVKTLFIHMLIKANWKDGRFQGQEIKRGSFVSSLQNLSNETTLTVNEIRTAIKHLKSTGEITSKSHSKFTVFTVIGYDDYQGANKQTHSQITSRSHSVNTRLTTIEEKKEGKKERIKDKKNKKEPDPYFPNDDLLNKTFLEFIEHRKAMKKPMTEIAISKMINKLNKYSRGIAIASLDKSMENGWQGIFPEKESEPSGKEATNGQSTTNNTEIETDDSPYGKWKRGEIEVGEFTGFGDLQ
ncbi:MAG: hypothetical protein ACRC3H_13055 [Lachnospiraceae bacterium]